VVARRSVLAGYNQSMTRKSQPKLNTASERHDDAYLQEYFEICKRIYLQMRRDGTWPWESDSPNSEDMIDSENNDIL